MFHCPYAIADIVQKKHHYMHRSVQSISESFILVSPDEEIRGVLMFGTPNSAAAMSPFFPGQRVKVAELKRMWLDDSVPRNGESFFMWSAMRQLGASPALEGVEAVISYADPLYHEGTVYRAANFTYCGQGPENLKLTVDGEPCSASILSDCRLETLRMVFKDKLVVEKQPGKLRFIRVTAEGKRGKELNKTLSEFANRFFGQPNEQVAH